MSEESSTDPAGPQRLRRERELALLDLGLGEAEEDRPSTSPQGPEQPGDLIGRYRLVSLLGSGGFGNVWLAAQTEPIHREVALKLIKPGMDSWEISARFEAERQTLALMDHPNIARVLDAGTSAAGRPYFVLELVRGKPITTHCDDLRLGIRERIALFIEVCQAVQHAHQKAILHRDLKPSNILVAQSDGKVVPKVIDFGIAKALGASAEEALNSSLLATRAGVVVGTPDYMSPEQAGCTSDVDTRSDIYTLGVILYELLIGTTPLAAHGPRGGFDEVLRRIREQEAVRPSTWIARDTADRATWISEQRRTDPSRLARSLRGDLDWVVMKALEKDRQRRYGTATALALDLRAHLDGQTVTAAAPTWSYRCGKFVRRNRGGIIAASLIATALVTGTAVSLWQARQAERSRGEAQRNADQAKEAVEKFLSRVTDHPRLNEPEFADFKLNLLQEAINFYEKTSSSGGGSLQPGIRSDRAWTLGRLGKLYHATGDDAKAVTALRSSVDIDEGLMAEFPRNADYRRAAAMRANNLAVMLHATGERTGEQAVRARALELLERCLADAPEDAGIRQNLALVLVNQADALNSAGRLDEARAAFDRATRIQEQLVAQFDDPNYRQQLGYLRGAAANYAKGRGDLDQADICYRDALTLYERLAADEPGNLQYREACATLSGNRGLLLYRLKKPAEGIGEIERAAKLFARLADDVPKRPDLCYNEATARMNRGNGLRTLERLPEAADEYGQAVSLMEKLAANFPKHPQFRNCPSVALAGLAAIREQMGERAEAQRLLARAVEFQKREFTQEPAKERARLADLQKRLTEACLQQGDHKAAAASAWELARLFPDRWEEWQWAATVGVRCLRMAEEGASPEAAEHLRRIVRELRQALANGYPDLARFCEQEHAPASLSDCADFQALLRETPGHLAAVADLDHAMEKVPAKFTYDYSFDDPGTRTWVRAGRRWTETQPSGGTSVYTISAAKVVEGLCGTELKRLDGASTLFVPLRDAEPMQLMFQQPSGLWVSLGRIEHVE